jgi:hypothetical protein
MEGRGEKALERLLNQIESTIRAGRTYICCWRQVGGVQDSSAIIVIVLIFVVVAISIAHVVIDSHVFIIAISTTIVILVLLLAVNGNVIIIVPVSILFIKGPRHLLGSARDARVEWHLEGNFRRDFVVAYHVTTRRVLASTASVVIGLRALRIRVNTKLQLGGCKRFPLHAPNLGVERNIIAGIAHLNAL